jgi:REP-associated tyrosine transposase
MPRQPRFVVPDIALHVRQRGNDGQACFHTEGDRLVYLANLRSLCAKTRCALHAYCLMTNHVHLLLTPPDAASCSSLMRDLGQRYVQYFNRRHERSGTLWEGRYRSCLVDSARYVLGCYRYIEMNPVRAGMVATPSDYRWSSYDVNTGRMPSAMLVPHAEYAGLAPDEAARYAAYQGFFGGEEDATFLAAIRDATDGGYALLGDEMKAKLAESGRRLERGKPGRRSARADDTPAVDELTLELGL